MNYSRSRLEGALAAYSALAILAVLTLDGGFMAIVLAILALFAFKSWIAVKKEEQE